MNLLVEELKEIGVPKVMLDEFGIVYEDDHPYCYFFSDEGKFEYEMNKLAQILEDKEWTLATSTSLKALEGVYNYLVELYT